jgi:hypothetical protein
MNFGLLAEMKELVVFGSWRKEKAHGAQQERGLQAAEPCDSH